MTRLKVEDGKKYIMFYHFVTCFLLMYINLYI